MSILLKLVRMGQPPVNADAADIRQFFQPRIPKIHIQHLPLSSTFLLRPIFYDLQLPWLIVADLPDIMT